MNLTKVTFTGADDSTAVASLIALSEQYPFVEWGILVSARQGGSPRFPSERWISKFAEEVGGRNMHISMHVCGRWVRQILKGDFEDFLKNNAALLGVVERVQLNFHAEPHEFDIDGLRTACNGPFRNKQVLMQMDETRNEGIFGAAVSARLPVAPLFDASGGAGLVPAAWPRAESMIPRFGYAGIVGYAGGLGPDSIKHEIQEIARVADDFDVWIDMERRVRSDDDTIFMLDKVQKVLDIVKYHVQIDWKEKLCQILQCYGDLEGVLLEGHWAEYGVSKSQADVIIKAYETYMAANRSKMND